MADDLYDTVFYSLKRFSISTLVAACQNGLGHARIERYLRQYPEEEILREINGIVEGFPTMFYAAQTFDEAVLRVMVKFGGDVNALCGEDPPLPLLAHVIINGKARGAEATSIMTTLLSLGASADAIPKAFFSPYDIDLPIEGPDHLDLKELDEAQRQWCRSPAVRVALSKSLNLSQRYFLDKSTKVPKTTGRVKMVVTRKKMEPLLAVPYLLIGQIPACSLLRTNLVSHTLLRNKKPLTLVFAGTNGHGKTELALQLGRLLSLDLEVVDCTAFTDDRELFGSRKGFEGNLVGSRLNNFLADHNSKRCIVFLDEFEKTTAKIHETLLKIFAEGISFMASN